MQQYLSIPGHMPVKEVAALCGLSEERILQHIRARNLPSQKVDGRYMIPRAALATFQRNPHGRTRKKPVAWHRYRAGAVVHVLNIDVRAFSGCVEALQDCLLNLEITQQHCFPGTMQRYISASLDDPGQLVILLIWKDTELADEATLQRDFEAFKAEFAELLDWGKAHISHAEALAYT